MCIILVKCLKETCKLQSLCYVNHISPLRYSCIFLLCVRVTQLLPLTLNFFASEFIIQIIGSNIFKRFYVYTLKWAIVLMKICILK